jgi:hypothetical protein
MVEGLPVREFRWFRGRQFYSGWYWSSTMQKLVAYESRLELARILLADIDPTVVGIASQPFLLVGDDHGRKRRHVPDLLLLHDSGAVTVVDVKPQHRLADAAVAVLFAWTERVVRSRGWTFEVWSGTDAELLANVRFLAGYRRRQFIDEQLAGLAIALAASSRTLGELEQALTAHAPAPLIRPVVLHLLWSGALLADLDRLLGTETPIRLAGATA